MLTSEYNLWKSQINEEDAKKVSFDQYRKAVSYVGDYDYKSIRDKQIGRELVFKIGVYTVAAIVAVPCVLTGNAPGALLSFSIASYVCGSTSVTGAITGTNPISGRTISSDERWVEGISGGVQVLSGAYGIYSYAPPAFTNALNTTSPTIGSVADIVDDVNNGGSDGVKIGDNFGKMGTYTEKPNLNVDWKQYANHAMNDSMIKRGITQEMVDSYVTNGKALAQAHGKYAFVSRDGVAVVTSNGKLITTWSSADFDTNMLEIVNKLFANGK